MTKKICRIGVLGLGTVGSGVVRLLRKNGRLIEKRLGVRLRVERVAERDASKVAALGLSPSLVGAAPEVAADPAVDVVAELIGGTTIARECILKALASGKPVVTANKALLAERGREIFSAARDAGREVLFEASVAGGIPVIRTLREGLSANRISSILGIVNGTSNYVLSRMDEANIGFAEALDEAKEKGYAEADPTLDIEGADAGHKIAILASLAGGRLFSFRDVYTEGISKVTAQDISYARELGYVVKPLAIAKVSRGGMEARVHPTLVPEDSPLTAITGATNAVFIRGNMVGETMLSGEGAGALPTASAVVSDLIELAMRETAGAGYRGPGFDIDGKSDVKPMADVESMYYFRFSVIDRPGVLAKITGALGKHHISIAAVIQKGRFLGGVVPVIMMTHSAREADAMRALKEIDRFSSVKAKTQFLRVEGGEVRL